jgi:hypothetical protein
MTNAERLNSSFVIRHFLPIDRSKTPISNHDLRPRRHIANLAGNLNLLALGGFAKPRFEFLEFLAALASPANFFFAFADAHRGELTVQSLGLRVRRRNHEPV